MKIKLILGTLFIFGGLVSVQAGDEIDDSQIGLVKVSVYDVDTPPAFAFPTDDPDEVDGLPRAFPGAPPQVPHEMASMLPLQYFGDSLKEGNQCLDCHDKPRHIGKKSSRRSPMSKSHYNAVGPQKSWKISGTRFNCNQCHTPVSDAKPLVASTFMRLGD